MIANTIKILQSGEFYGGGEYIELAKGKYEYVSNYKGFKRKLKRQWQLLRK